MMDKIKNGLDGSNPVKIRILHQTKRAEKCRDHGQELGENREETECRRIWYRHSNLVKIKEIKYGNSTHRLSQLQCQNKAK